MLLNLETPRSTSATHSTRVSSVGCSTGKQRGHACVQCSTRPARVRVAHRLHSRKSTCGPGHHQLHPHHLCLTCAFQCRPNRHPRLSQPSRFLESAMSVSRRRTLPSPRLLAGTVCQLRETQRLTFSSKASSSPPALRKRQWDILRNVRHQYLQPWTCRQRTSWFRKTRGKMRLLVKASCTVMKQFETCYANSYIQHKYARMSHLRTRNTGCRSGLAVLRVRSFHNKIKHHMLTKFSEAVEDARHNFGQFAVSNVRTSPVVLPLPPKSRRGSRARRPSTKRSARIPRKALAANQIFNDDATPNATIDASGYGADYSANTGGEVSVSLMLPTPKNVSSLAVAFPTSPVPSPVRPRRNTIASRSPKPSSASRSRSRTSTPSKQKDRSKSTGRHLQMPITPVAQLNYELDRCRWSILS
jgi:hypothetical protein